MATDTDRMGVSKPTYELLKSLIAEESFYFKELQDGYVFAIAYALANKKIEPNLPHVDGFERPFHFSQIDKGGLFDAIKALREPGNEEPVHLTAEKLAEWGVKKLAEIKDKSEIDFTKILEDAEKVADH